MEVIEVGLGRGIAVDPRDQKFLMSAAAEPSSYAPDRPYRYWNAEGWWGDQGRNPWCVAYAWLHYLEDGPTTQPVTPHRALDPILRPRDVYCRAQSMDEWDGDCSRPRYDGTSVRAGAKVLQQEGLIGGYRWAFDTATVIQTILDEGPVVFGTWWYNSMFYPDQNGIVRITDNRRAGGHAYIANGVRLQHGLTVAQAVARNAGLVRFKNSWGRGWGRNGHFYMDLATVDRLVREQGEACIATEIRRERPE